MNREMWLQCQITPGQFSGEYAVEGLMFDGRGFSLFANEDDLHCPSLPTGKDPVAAFLRVCVIEQKGNLVLVQLPQQTLENGYAVTVKADQLRSMATPQRA